MVCLHVFLPSGPLMGLNDGKRQDFKPKSELFLMCEMFLIGSKKHASKGFGTKQTGNLILRLNNLIIMIMIKSEDL